MYIKTLCEKSLTLILLNRLQILLFRHWVVLAPSHFDPSCFGLMVSVLIQFEDNIGVGAYLFTHISIININ